MLNLRLGACAPALLSACLLTAVAAAQEYTVEKLASPAPADALAPEIAALLQPTGLKVAKGTRTVCEIWLCKEWPNAEAKSGGDVIYPLVPGQIFGAIRFPRKSADFRDQEVPSGTYTLRYGQQPVDGAHAGTSPTRDFLLVLPADQDRSPAPLDYKALTKASAATIGANHPAILSLQRVEGEGDPALSIRHNEDHDWWLVRFTGKTKNGNASKDLTLDLVVVGKGES